MKLLITGITTQSSMAYAVAEEAMKQGHEVILSNPPGRQLSILRRIARRLPAEPVDKLLQGRLRVHGDAKALGLPAQWLDQTQHEVGRDLVAAR